MSSLYRKRQKHRINKLHRKKAGGKSRGKGRAWNTKNKSKKKNIVGKAKRMENKIKKRT